MASDLSPLTPSGHDGGLPDDVDFEHELPFALPQIEPIPSQPSQRMGADPLHAAATTQPGPKPIHGWFRRYRMNLLMVGLDVSAALVTLRFSGVTLWLSVVGTLLLVALNCCSGLNRSRFTLSALDDAPALAGRALSVSMAVLVVSSLGTDDPTPSTLGVLSLALVVLLLRSLGYEAVRSARRRGRHQHRALVLGAGVVGRDLAQAMLDKTELGLVPVGFVDASPLGGPTGLPVPVVGAPGDLARAIVETEADHVIIAFTALRESEMVAMLRTCDRLEAEIAVVPRLFELAHRESDTDEIDGVTVVRLRRAPFRTPLWHLKRAFDLTTSGLALLVLSPLLALVALLIRVVDGPGILFRQERVGLDEGTFDLLKFRSLKPSDSSESDTRWNIKNDDRMSWLGKLLRRSSIDELPQLWNIVRGDMSLVGPRPERPHFVATFDEAFPRYGARHRVPSGLTGWAQIHGLRGDTSIEERARFDNYYIENWSLWLDIKIILRTLASITKGSG